MNLKPLFTFNMAEPAPEPETETVKFCRKSYDLDTKEVAFTFGNDEEVVCDVSKMSTEMQTRLMLHGALQKIGDSYAGAKGNFVKGVNAAKAVIDQLMSGQWAAARGEGEGRPRLGELAEAIARIKSVPVERALAVVEAANDKQRADWRSTAKVRAVLAQIRAEKAAAELEAATEKDLVINLD